MKRLALLMGLAFAAGWAQAKLVARWDFNNFDSADPTSTNVLAATVGDAAYPCYYNGKGSKLVTTTNSLGNVTLGNMYMAYASSSDSTAVTAFNALGANNYAIAIPARSHIALPIPSSVKNHPWTIKIRCWIPATGWHCFFNRNNATDGDLFMTPARSGRTTSGIGGNVFGNNNNYQTAIGVGSWQTVTVSGGTMRHDVFLNETTQAVCGNNANNLNFFGNESLTTYNGKTCLLLSADDDGEDGLMYVDYVEIFDTAAAYEGRLPHYTKDGLVGEWTFPTNNPLKATVGQDLEYYTRTGSKNFASRTDGLMPGDSTVRKGVNNSFKCYHNLPANSSYTLVMDVRILTTANYHALLQPTSANNCDAPIFLYNKGNGGNNFWFKWSGRNPESTVAAVKGEWRRIVITHTGSKTTSSVNDIGSHIYSNGVSIDWNGSHNAEMTAKKGGWWFLLGDENGEDNAMDISYAAIYDRELSSAEIQELHSRPLAQDQDESFIPTVAPAGIWQDTTASGTLTSVLGDPLTKTSDGGYTWTRSSAPTAATYVFDLTLPTTQTAGGTLVKNSSNVASGIYGTGSSWNGSFTTTTDPANFLSNNSPSTWGYWSESTLDRTSAHRLTVVWAKQTGRVHYYVDGCPWGQIFPANANTANAPTATMSFLNGLGATVTQVKAYDVALTPDEVAGLGGISSDDVATAPVPTIAHNVVEGTTRALADTVTFTVSATQAEGEYVAYDIDYGDGTTHGTTGYLASGTSKTFTHVYGNTGPYTAKITAVSQSGASASASTDSFTLVASTKAATDILATWPWQQNVYTNRFTVMCEAKSLQQGLELQWGEDYANRVEMSYVVGNGSTYIYKAHITVPDELVGTQVPYRLGFCGLALTSTEATNDTAGVAKLWNEDANASFTCAIWGDNQQGARSGDWDADFYLFVRSMFTDMIARDVDFGISTGDMASSANYSSQIKPGILVATDGIFGRTRPYYVAWGNHDTSYPANKPYFETVAVDDPSYLSSEKGNGYLYRNNVLFIFIDQQLHATAATKTWLENLLATDRAKAAKFRILVHHYPVYGECWGSLNQYLLDTIKAGGIDLVLSGHMHGYERIQKDGFVQLTNGGMGYLDHTESIVNNYGEATFVGGHQKIPYLWARQKSKTDTSALGPAEPVRMGCIQSYGELKVVDNVLTYTARGYNADGSYIGDFDTFAITSKTVTASAPAATAAEPVYCADNSSFAAFTTKPVTNAKWAEYKTAIGETFTYPEGADDNAVVNVSKVEIEAFCAWLNGADGANGTYRLPTVAELTAAFDGEFARDVSEWTRSIDPETGWCRVLGGNTNAVTGTWCRAEDKPCIATAGCHANYLGFRLATGAVPAETVSPLAAPLAALDAVESPAEVYAWQDGALVDITSEWRTDAPTALTYDVPVIFTGAGALTFTNNNAVVFNAGFAAPKSAAFTKVGTGALTIKGAVKGGETTSAWGWSFTTGGTLAIEDVTFAGQSCGFASGDLTLSLKGENDFSGATMPFGGANNRVTNLVAAAGATTLKLRALRDLTATQVVIGKDVTVTASEDLQVNDAYTFWVDGTLDVNGLNAAGNVDPRYLGAGTVKTTYFGSYQNSYQYLAASNIVLTSGNPWRTNNSGDHGRYYISGSRVRLTSLYPWTLNLVDTWNMAFTFVSVPLDEQVPHLVFAGDQTVHFNPTSCNVALEVEGGTVLVKKLPTTSTTATSETGAWGADETLALSAGQQMAGAFVAGGTLAYTFGTSIAAGDWRVLTGSGRAAGDITVTTDADTTKWLVTEMWSETGDLILRVQDASTSKIAVWTDGGDRTNPLDAANWSVTSAGAVVEGAVPDAATAILVSGATAMNVPATEGFAYGSLIISEKVELTADCDWTALTNVVLAANSVIDLKGHKLTLSNMRAAVTGKGVITDSTTDADHPGELHLDIASGVTFVNSTVALTGNFKLVKEGEGIYTANYGASSYTGGTDVRAGTARPGNSVEQRFGAWYTTIDVAAGATFDLWSRVMSQYNFRLNGCTFQNTLNASTGTSTLGNFELTADQTFNYTTMSVDNSITVLTNAVWDLGGHTFTIGISGGRYLRLQGPHSLTNGTLEITSGGWLETNTFTNDCRTVNLIVNCALNLTQPLSVRDYTAKYAANYNLGTAGMNVYGTFTPACAYFYGCTLQDGAVIDLSDKTDVWSTTSSFTTTGLNTISFADNAKISVDLGTRKFPERTQVVSWTTAPTNLATLKFVSPSATLFAESDGIYAIQSGLMIIIR